MSWIVTHEFAERLRDLKSHRGWTIEDIAAKCELPKGTVERYLTTRYTAEPKLEALVKLSVGLDVSLNWLALGRGPIALPNAWPETRQ